jgi:hypothetical protein
MWSLCPDPAAMVNGKSDVTQRLERSTTVAQVRFRSCAV